MSTTPLPNVQTRCAHILILVGTIAMLVGAIDPMEGSLLILPGSGLVALGTFLGRSERRFLAFRMRGFALIAIGVGAMCGLSAVGGFGGDSGRSIGWGLLVLPYPIGWLMGVCGPDSPRWSLLLGIVIGLWYLVILAVVLMSGGLHRGGPAILIGALGLLTIVGCLSRLRHPTAQRSWAGSGPQR